MHAEILRLAKSYLVKLPQHRAAILELAELASDEINAGESVENEAELMVAELQDLE